MKQYRGIRTGDGAMGNPSFLPRHPHDPVAQGVPFSTLVNFLINLS
jgi:hypothetical protein